jgi:hypothetical protein
MFSSARAAWCPSPHTLTMLAVWTPVWTLAAFGLATCVENLGLAACLLAATAFGATCFVAAKTLSVVKCKDSAGQRDGELGAAVCWMRVVQYAYVAAAGLPALLVTSAAADARSGPTPHAAFMAAYATLVYTGLSALDALVFWKQGAALLAPEKNNNTSSSRVSLATTLEKAVHHALTLWLLAAAVRAHMVNMGTAIYVLYTTTSLPLYVRTVAREQSRARTDVLDAVFAIGWLVVRMPGTLAWTAAAYATQTDDNRDGTANVDTEWCAHALLLLNCMNLFWSSKVCTTLYAKFNRQRTP